MASTGGRSGPILGGVLTVAGAVLVSLAFLDLGVLNAALEVVPADMRTPAIAGAGVLLLVTGLGLLRAQMTAADPEPEVEEPLELGELPEIEEEMPTQVASGSTRYASNDGPRDPEVADEMHDLDARIKEITRRINRAKVKLGTGKLSPQGYQKVVDELEEKRAALEKERVDLELDSSDL